MSSPGTRRVCDAPDCGRPHRAKGLCYSHWQRRQKLGNFSLAPIKTPAATLADAFCALAPTGSPDECWIWQRALNNNGYGRFERLHKAYLAHRVAYELAKGLIPDGLVIDHLCRTPACVNPAHLEAVTQLENCRRATALGAACRRGHDTTVEANVYRCANGRSQCRVCLNEGRRRRASASRGAARQES